MVQYDNPAGRLHACLSALGGTDPSLSLTDAWCHVLGIPQDELVIALGPVAQLIGAVNAAVVEQGDEAFVKSVVRYRQEWAH